MAARARALICDGRLPSMSDCATAEVLIRRCVAVFDEGGSEGMLDSERQAHVTSSNNLQDRITRVALG